MLLPLRPTKATNIAIITLEATNTSRALLRLGHQFGLGEDPTLSQPVKIDLSTLFAPGVLRITNAIELSLSANQAKASLTHRRASQTPWHIEGEAGGEAAGVSPSIHPWRAGTPFDWRKNSVVTLGPLEIKTFLITIG